jgi:rubrerythrin
MSEERVLRSLLRTAIQREADSCALYSHIAAQVSDAGARAKFGRLAGEEQGHRQVVEKMYTDRFGKLDFTPKAASLPDFSGEQKRRVTAIEAVKMAIKKEKESQKFYADLGEKTDTKEAAALCGKMREQEAGHEKILQDEYRVLTNQFYWYPILEPPWHLKEDL